MRRKRSSRMFNLWFDGRFVDEHHGDVILDWIHAPALRALQRGAVLDELDLRLAVGARQDLEQLRIDHESVPQGLLYSSHYMWILLPPASGTARAVGRGTPAAVPKP